MSEGTRCGWSVAEAAVLAEVPVAAVRSAAAQGAVVIEDERLSDDDVVRLAALARLADGGPLARRRTRTSLRALTFGPAPCFLVRHPNGVVVAVDPERVAAHVSRPGGVRGFDPGPIRQRLGCADGGTGGPAPSA